MELAGTLRSLQPYAWKTTLTRRHQMSKKVPILITGAGGAVGSVSKKMIELLLAGGHRVRGFVRTDDERAEALRVMGAEVFVGDLMNPADLANAMTGCRASISA